jgi:hypothetical protein
MVTNPANYAVTEDVLVHGVVHQPPLTLMAGVFRYGTERRMPSATFAGALYPIDPVVDHQQNRASAGVTRE